MNADQGGHRAVASRDLLDDLGPELLLEQLGTGQVRSLGVIVVATGLRVRGGARVVAGVAPRRPGLLDGLARRRHGRGVGLHGRDRG